jgi:hypothetical protein
MPKRITAALPAVSFVAALALGSISLFASPKETWSLSERRPLASAPELSGKTIMDGSWFGELDGWMADHFVNREEFRHLRMLFQTKMLREHEYNGFIEYNGYLINLQKEINEDSVGYAAERFGYVWEKYLKKSGGNIYCTLVPDKSSLVGKYGYPTIDTANMDKMYEEALPFAKAFSLRAVLELEDYYFTDTHWRQEKLIPVAKYMLETMGRDVSLLDESFETEEIFPFFGVYAGQSAMKPEGESIRWLTGGFIDRLNVTDLETRAPMPVCDPENCDEKDLYTLFLGGGKGLVRIDNPAAPEGELIVFRDSFGSSMAPLLASGYRTVYVVDLRYAHPDVLGRYIRFNGQDVLFMFSETLLNNSRGLR